MTASYGKLRKPDGANWAARSAFELILWVSVGQEPDIRELQASLLLQINDTTLSSEVPDDKVAKELKAAAKGLKVVLRVRILTCLLCCQAT